MKTRSIILSLITLFLGLFISKVIQSQPLTISPTDAIKAYQPVAELGELPSFPGGMAERLNYLTEYLPYSLTAVENAIEGDVRVKSVVGTNGNSRKPEPVILDMEVMRRSYALSTSYRARRPDKKLAKESPK
ncbi:MAG: hypothetical protein KTR30_35540 [Saprospiraceae bacterium]|nr:hypothetical protein [Saprospiraceae bacterium]